jgi:hypothetical protein
MLFAAAGLAALTNADLPLVAELFNLLTLGTIIILGYSIWTSEQEERAFCCGFAGWAGFYFVATKWFAIVLLFGTHKLIAIVQVALTPGRISTLSHAQPSSGGSSSLSQAYDEWLNGFDSIAQNIICLILGFIGGWVTVYFYRKRQAMLAKGR